MATRRKPSSAAVQRRQQRNQPPVVPNSTGRMTTVAPKNKPKPRPLGVPGVKDWLAGDEDYMTLINSLNSAKNLQQGQYTTNQANALMDYNKGVGDFRQMMPRQNTSLAGDYASRGMLNSGGYASDLINLGTQQNKALDEMATTYGRQKADLSQGNAMFQLQDKTSRQMARNAALARRREELRQRALMGQ